jgi:hypothetical protein
VRVRHVPKQTILAYLLHIVRDVERGHFAGRDRRIELSIEDDVAIVVVWRVKVDGATVRQRRTSTVCPLFGHSYNATELHHNVL